MTDGPSYMGIWITACREGALVAISLHGTRRTLHAIGPDEATAAWSDGMKRAHEHRRQLTTIGAACGARVRLLGSESDDGVLIRQWPPRLDELAADTSRCPDCKARYPRRKRRRNPPDGTLDGP